jgi:alpha-L-fucosidase
MGQWMKVNGDSIYATGPSPFKSLDWGRATQKGNRLFLHVFKWPAGDLVVPSLRNTVKRAYLLAEPGKTLQFAQKSDSISVKVPGAAPDPVATVVALDLDGPPQPN